MNLAALRGRWRLSRRAGPGSGSLRTANIICVNPGTKAPRVGYPQETAILAAEHSPMESPSTYAHAPE